MEPSPTISPRTGPATASIPEDNPSPLTQSTTTSDTPSHPAHSSLTSQRPTLDRLSLGNDGGRRPSVQFMPHVKVGEQGSRSQSRKPVKEVAGRRLSSPPPPNQFQPRVSFDTFDNRDASDFSLTLNRKHKDYHYSKRSRTFLCGTDTNDYSDTALEWLIDELVDDGDEVVCLRVIEKDSKDAQKYAAIAGSSREGREKGYREEAERMLKRIQDKNVDDKAINLILEFSVGKIQDTIQHMIRIYEPAILVVGTRGRSLGGFQGLLPGSVSKYCLQHSPVPVIVVRPSSKRDKKKRKRLLDPARRGYRDILDKSEDVAEGGHILDERNRLSMAGADGLLGDVGKYDEEEEARRVAEAIGYRPQQGGSGNALTKTMSNVSATSNRSRRSGSLNSDMGPEDMRSPGHLLKSPELRDLDSPLPSDESASEDEDEEVPEYIRLQDEALMKAHERAMKAEEELRELEAERVAREERLKALKENRKGGRRGQSPSGDGGGGAGALDVLAALSSPGRKGR